MDLQSILEPGDLFLSYWLDQDLLILAGDCREILASQSLPHGRLEEFALEFERQVSLPECYGAFIAEDYRPFEWPAIQPTRQTPRSLLESLAGQLVPPEIERLVRTGVYDRLILFPDGVLHAVPFQLVFEYRSGIPWQRLFPEGVLYASSATAYTYAVQKKHTKPPENGLIVVGDKSDAALIQEAERMVGYMPCPARTCTTREELQELAPKADIVYIATHGYAPEQNQSGGWSLLFDGGTLRPDDFYRERLRLKRGALVALSACSVGQLRPGMAHELDGMLQSFFFAGAASVLSARWPILYECAEAVFAGTLEKAYQGRMSLGAAMGSAISHAAGRADIREMMSGEEAAPFFWGGYAIFGCGSA